MLGNKKQNACWVLKKIKVSTGATVSVYF